MAAVRSQDIVFNKRGMKIIRFSVHIIRMSIYKGGQSFARYRHSTEFDLVRNIMIHLLSVSEL